MQTNGLRLMGPFVGIALLACPASSEAHDFWIEPDSFYVEAGQAVPVRLKVGSKKDVQTVKRQPERILRLEGATRTKTFPVEGAEGADPVGTLGTTTVEGEVLLVYQSNHAYIEMEPEAFERYLEHEGLKVTIEERKRLGEADKDGKESYARSCKALLTVGKPGSGWAEKLGLPLEIVPVKDPRKKGEKLVFSILADGQPLAQARLDLMKIDDLETFIASKSDAKGQASFPAPAPGRYVVAVTHMARAKPPVKGDWVSNWATFAFEVR